MPDVQFDEITCPECDTPLILAVMPAEPEVGIMAAGVEDFSHPGSDCYWPDGSPGEEAIDILGVFMRYVMAQQELADDYREQQERADG